jgi:hypothetical protein
VKPTPGPILTLVGIGVFVATLAGLPARATYGAQTSADEPQYLLTALSLFDDGDLDIADERYPGIYRQFHEATLPVQTDLRPDGSRVSPHNPLLPAILAVPMGLGGWVAAKTTLAVAAGALAAVLVWVGVHRLDLSLATATLVVTVFSVSPPLAFYATQVYPEIPAALVVTVGIATITGSPSRRAATILLAVVLALPWLAVKYLPIALVLTVAGLWRLRKSRLMVAVIAMLLVVAGISYLWFNQVIYGGWTPYASGDFFISGELTAIGPQPNYLGRTQRLLGLLVDRGFGLAAWQPAYLFAVPATVWALRSKRPGSRLLLWLTAVGWLVATFVAQTMHGWWWPGRQLVAVLPPLILLIAAWVEQSRIRGFLFLGAGSLGVFAYLFLASEAAVGRLTLIVDFTRTLNPFYRIWSLALPDYLEATTATWALHGIWLAIAAGLAVWGWGSGRAEIQNQPNRPSDAQPDLAVRNKNVRLP